MDLIAHLLLAVIEFFVINWLGKHSISSGYYQITFVQNYEDAPLFNLVFRVLAPSVYLVLCSALLYQVGGDSMVLNIWRVTPLYFAFRWSFNISLGRARLLVWPNQFAIAAIASALSVVVYREFLSARELVVPSARGLVDELWIVVILFLYQTFRNVSPFGSTDALRSRRTLYLRAAYKSAREKYHATISGESRHRYTELLAYSVLIYESFNRPRLYQLIERHVFFPLGFASSLGPMQVRTAEAMSDADLVAIGVRKLQRDFDASADIQQLSEAIATNPESTRVVDEESESTGGRSSAEPITYWRMRRALEDTLKKYNIRSDYPDQVLGIFDELHTLYYRDLPLG